MPGDPRPLGRVAPSRRADDPRPRPHAGTGREPVPSADPLVMSRHRARGTVMATLLAVALALILAITSVVPATKVHADDSVAVSGDDERDAFVGSGSGLLLDRRFTGGEPTRRRIATCPGCRWELQPPCQSGRTACIARRLDCPPPERVMTVWFSEGPGPLRLTGVTCIGPAGPRRAQDLVERIDDQVVTLVPPLRPTIHPTPALMGLPIRAAAGQPTSLGRRTLRLAGHRVVLDASATWRWDWGDGTSDALTRPQAEHQWRRAGLHQVRVEATWRGWFTVDGLGPFPAGGAAVRQQAVIRVDVRPAESVLLVR